MTRPQSEKIKRRAALATFLSLAFFSLALFVAVASERAMGSRREHSWASDRARSFRATLQKSADSAAWQQELQQLVQPEGPVIAAVVVGRDRKIRAAVPGRADLVGQTVVRGDRWEPLMGEDELKMRVRDLMAATPAIGRRAFEHGLIAETLTDTRGDHVGWLFALAVGEKPAGGRLPEFVGPLAGISALVSFSLYWFMLPLWVYLDARPRTNKAVPLALFVFLTNFLGWLTYLVIRPESDRCCPACDSALEPGFRLCPLCGWSNTLRCHSCGRPARADWRFCPHCETPRPDLDLTLTR